MTKEQLLALGKRLKQCRKSRALTQEQTAELLEITYSSYSKIENGFQQPGIDLLIHISDVFALSLDYLIFGVGERNLLKLSEKEKESALAIADLLNQIGKN